MIVRDWWIDPISACKEYVSSEIPGIGNWRGRNVTGYSNPEYDALCGAAFEALPGTAEHEGAHRDAQGLFSTELPSIPLFVWPRIAVAHPGVLNLGLDSTSQSELWNIELIDVE
jgi:ABC-type transport system substrate-binding protein